MCQYYFFAVYINHRPAFGLSPEKLIKAFETLGLPTDKGFAIERGDLLDLMQTKGKHMCQLMKLWYIWASMPENLSSDQDSILNKNSEYDQEIPQSQTADKPMES